MSKYIIRRLLQFIPVVLVTSTLIFVLLRVIPGDPALNYLLGAQGEMASVDEAQLRELRQQLGLDKPVYRQYFDWLGGLVQGDLGTSLRSGHPVSEVIWKKFPVTLELAATAVVLAFLIAVTLGVLMAVHQDTWVDYMARVFSISGLALPPFWVGMLIILILSRGFGWLPPLGYKDFFSDPVENFKQVIWAVIPLTFSMMAFLSRVTRSSMLEVFRQDYIRTARAKGLRGFVILYRHGLRNALLPVLTVSGLQIAQLVGIAVVMESLFSLPGLGRELIGALLQKDMMMIQGIVLFVTVWVLTVNLVIDLAYGFLDPRVKVG